MSTPLPTTTVPRRPSLVDFTRDGPTVHVGGFLIRELRDGSLWIQNEIGEGMQCQPKHFLPALREFFNTHF